MKFKNPRPKKRPHFINQEIRAKEVRLIDADKTQIGIVPLGKALEIAREKELDLVAISPKAEPPVCRLLDYGKYLYSLQKKAHDAQKTQRKVHIKEIKFTPVIGEHDVEVKLKKIKEFLDEGNKVKVTIWLKGRQKRRPEMLGEMTNRILNILTEIAEIESPPKNERWNTHIMIGKKRSDKPDKPDKPEKLDILDKPDEGDKNAQT